MATLTQSDAEGVTVLQVSGGLTHDGVGPMAAAFEAATGGRTAPPRPSATPGRVLVELEHDNRLYVVSLERVLAIFRRSNGSGTKRAGPTDQLDPSGTDDDND